MCLIILANDPKSLKYDDLETAYKRNSDGFGVMYINKSNKFIADKFTPKNFGELKNFFNIHKSNAKNNLAYTLDLQLREQQTKKIVILLSVISLMIEL